MSRTKSFQKLSPDSNEPGIGGGVTGCNVGDDVHGVGVGGDVVGSMLNSEGAGVVAAEGDGVSIDGDGVRKDGDGVRTDGVDVGVVVNTNTSSVGAAETGSKTGEGLGREVMMIGAGDGLTTSSAGSLGGGDGGNRSK